MNDVTNAAMKKEANAELSRRLIDSFTSEAPHMRKQAQELVQDYTRTMLMENSFMHRILPAEPIQASELSEDINERKPFKLVDLEPNSRGAVTVQFGTIPNTMYFDGDKYKVSFNRILSPRITMDVAELLRYRYDIRQVLVDKQTKYIEFEKDRRFLDSVNYALVLTDKLGAMGNGLTTPRQMRSFPDGLTRESLVDAVQIMQSTNAHIAPSCALCNTKTFSEFAKWQFEEMGGGTEAADIIMNGLGSRRFMNLEWIVSIKHELIPDGYVYFFSSPDYLGKHYVLEDLTMWVKNEAFMLTSFQWTCAGAAIGNISGLAFANFNPTGLSDGGSPINTVEIKTE